MSASIVLSGLCWSAPDAKPVLDGIDLTFHRERAGIVGRNGAGKSTLLRLIAGELRPCAGRIAISGSVAKFRQIVATDPDETIADLFGVAGPLAVLDRAASGDADAETLAEADWALPTRLEAALAKVGLDTPPDTRLSRLSGGQRTRAALAAAIFPEPDFLLLDEPTNHLDRDGRSAVHDVLENWRGGALVASHDRELLERMDAIVELSSLGAARYGGNWSAYQARKSIERDAILHDLDLAERQAGEVARAAQIMIERKQRRDAAGARKGARGDMPRILIGKRRNRAESSGGDARRLAERQAGEAEQALAQARARVEVIESLSVVLRPSGLPAEKTVLELDHVSAGYDDAPTVLNDMSLTIVGPERLAVIGANGSGKSTLLALASGRLAARSGRVQWHVSSAMLDQDLGLLDPSLSVAANFALIHPTAGDNAARAALARFRFRGDAALRTVETLSGGEALRAALACVLGATEPPQFLILDEPTNHLDLESLAVIEEGLRSYDGALLVASHDEAFLEAIGIQRRISLGT